MSFADMDHVGRGALNLLRVVLSWMLSLHGVSLVSRPPGRRNGENGFRR